MTLSAGSRMIARYIVVMILPDDGDMDVVKLFQASLVNVAFFIAAN